MLSHVIKKLLDEATGLSFSPVIGMSESYPIASYKLSENSNETVKESLLEVRIQSEDFDELEVLREQVKNAIHVPTNRSSILVNNYLIRGKVSGGGILPMGEIDAFDSTQYFALTWAERK